MNLISGKLNRKHRTIAALYVPRVIEYMDIVCFDRLHSLGFSLAPGERNLCLDAYMATLLLLPRSTTGDACLFGSRGTPTRDRWICASTSEP
jgi:hypothetical protein